MAEGGSTPRPFGGRILGHARRQEATAAPGTLRPRTATAGKLRHPGHRNFPRARRHARRWEGQELHFRGDRPPRPWRPAREPEPSAARRRAPMAERSVPAAAPVGLHLCYQPAEVPILSLIAGSPGQSAAAVCRAWPQRFPSPSCGDCRCCGPPASCFNRIAPPATESSPRRRSCASCHTPPRSPGSCRSIQQWGTTMATNARLSHWH